MKGSYHNEEFRAAQSAPPSVVYGAVASLEPRTLAVLFEAVSPDDAAELIKERRLEVLDLGEDWHALHWMLARRPEVEPAAPLTWAVLGHVFLKQLDRGGGAPGIVQPRDAKLVADALAELAPKTARLRFDREAMDRAGIYPGRWRSNPPRKPSELLSYLKPLAALYRRAAKAGAGTVGYRY